MKPRWRKLVRDAWAERGRALLMTVAISVSVMGIGVVLGAYAVLTHEMPRNYFGTQPASAALEITGGVDEALLREVRAYKGIAQAEAGEIVLARAKVGADWRPLLLFVIDDFNTMRINTFKRESGAWPPPTGTMLIERTAEKMLEAGEGGRVLVKSPHGSPQQVRITGVVHDPGLAPAWQEREGYGYITRATLRQLGEPNTLDELRVTFAKGALDIESVEQQTSMLAEWLAQRGHKVEQARVPPPGRHPHQTQMMGVLFLMLTFSGLALVLSGILVATSMAALLARQVREIGVMKAFGARTAQIAGLYAVLVALIGVAAVLLALPVGVLGAGAFARMSALMLNLEVSTRGIPWWVFFVQVSAGILVPLLVSAIPIVRGSRITVRDAIDQHGVGAVSQSKSARTGLTISNRSLTLLLRNVFRRRTRLLLTLGLLAAGGAMFMTALNIAGGWERIVARVHENRHYDVEVRLNAPADVEGLVRDVSGISKVEAWGYSTTAFWQTDRVDIVRTYPDGSHGSLSIMGVPATTRLIDFPLLSGRWLRSDDTDAVVLNHMALSQSPSTKVGDRITLSLDGRPTRWRVVGVVEEVGSPGVAYVTRDAFAQAAHAEQRTRMMRIATTTSSSSAREQVIRAIEQQLERANVSVEVVMPLAVLRTAMGDHVVVLIRMLLAMAALMVIVGTLGLASTMGTNVVERTREIGVMKTIGATPARIALLIVGEAAVISALSWLAAATLAIPLTAVVGKTVGMLAFRVRLPLVMDWRAVASWLVLVLVVSALATWLPARRASKLTVWEALGRV